MTITDFIAQAHPATLEYLENDLMLRLVHIDALNKALKTFDQEDSDG